MAVEREASVASDPVLAERGSGVPEQISVYRQCSLGVMSLSRWEELVCCVLGKALPLEERSHELVPDPSIRSWPHRSHALSQVTGPRWLKGAC